VPVFPPVRKSLWRYFWQAQISFYWKPCAIDEHNIVTTKHYYQVRFDRNWIQTCIGVCILTVWMKFSLLTYSVTRPCINIWPNFTYFMKLLRFRLSCVEEGVVNSILAFGSTAYFQIMLHQPSASWDYWRSAHWTIQFVDCCSSLS